MAGVVKAIDSALLGTIAAELAVRETAWEVRTGEVPVDRSYERILLTDTYEVWVICWPVGTELELHDHGDSAGAFTVVAGRLDETVVLDGVPVVRNLVRGDTSTFGPGDVHAVANRGHAPVTSVHVYSPPLEYMDFYDQSDDGGLLATRHDVLP